MTIIQERSPEQPPAEEPRLTEYVGGPRPRGWVKFVTSTDHKQIGLNYMVTAIVGFVVAGVMAEAMRTQLIAPNNHFVSLDVYNQLLTMHGTIMLFVVAGPFAFGLANYIVPLQIGAPDMAFPRFNNLSYWLYLGGFVVLTGGFLTNNGAANFGWFGYSPLTDAVHSPGPGADMWIVGIALTGFSGIFTAINLITTVFCLRAPGMVMFRMPILTWNMLVTMFLVLLAFPVLTSAMALLWADRHLNTHFYDPSGGGQPILWQHLFWFFGHPEVYILALPYFGVTTEVLATMSKKPVFGYKGMVGATLAIGGLSMGVWAHHMFTTGAVLLPFFAALSLLIAVPTGIKFFNWIGTMWRGTLTLNTAMLFSVGFLGLFLFGGFTGVVLAQPPLDFQTHNTYFVIGHFHYIVAALVLGIFSSIYYWFPKYTGRMLDERLGKVNFVLMFIGFNLAFFPMHDLGLRGMSRRIATYDSNLGFNFLNLLSTIGAYITALGVIPLVVNIFISLRKGTVAGDNPWDAQTLEWATSSPPPDHNFESLPPIRSERPLWDANHPDQRTRVGH
ncbi:cytochrome c oxidase subunit I [Acidiferrimicrobium sp. IK]|uniref:cytochrome c oxidase subunit I n=1 Tax=Acidiferrimicrobium sp. IK TaxID=2871700 RepID=UPI0021CAF3F4|nr:cytochrome c oxidase subunit I [Acidiferrimicrobium sp. IK]